MSTPQPYPPWANPNASSTAAGAHHSNAYPSSAPSAGSPYPASYPGTNGTGPHSHTGAGPPGPPSTTAAAAVPDSYFTESRKGEVNELRNLLRNFATERDQTRKREIIKKVIAYMTLGIDVSRLFTEMMLAIETRDLVIKKMVYLFLCNYATTHPDLAQMCTNTLQKDCGNDDPMVRGLALRALCSLRLPQMVEYISEPLRKSLTDSHAYVRKTGVMGILKLFHLDAGAFESCNFVDILYDMLRDPDASVVSNCILVLNEIMAKSPNGGMAINRAIMLHLLNRIHEFSEFGIVEVLDLIPRYIPANDEEGYQIMNLLDPVLRTTNSGAVLATIKAFLSLAEQIGDNADEMKRQVILRVKAPLVTHVAAGSPELVYCLLRHVDALVDMCPGSFDDEYRQFYIRYNEPTHIKYLKISLLAKFANPNTAPDIVSELAECVADVDVTLSRLAVKSMSRIACHDTGGEGCADSIARRLVEMLDLNVPHVSSEAAMALKDVVRKHPRLRSVVAPPLPRALRYVTEPAGKASVLFLLGECGDIVPEAPYAMERLIDSYDDIADAGVKTALLTGAMKLFFKRPPEVQKMLGRLLSKATEDVSSQDLHDRALLYYRLLRTSPDPQIVASIVAGSETNIPDGTGFAEEQDGELRAALMDEFNTLSILYGTTSENFIAEEYQVKLVKMPPEHPLDPSVSAASSSSLLAGGGGGGGGGAVDTSDHLVDQMGQVGISDSAINTESTAFSSANGPAPVPATSSEPVIDLLGFGDEPSPAPVHAPSSSTLSLRPSMSLSGDEYQTKWGEVPDTEAIVVCVPLRVQPTSTNAVEGALAKSNVLTMASGELPNEFKFFLYAQENNGGNDDGYLFLIQAVIGKGADRKLSLTIKLCGGGKGGNNKGKIVDDFLPIIKSALSEFV